MQIIANVRPKGLKRGISTKRFYKLLGFKDESGPDVRDVVGALTLSARQPSEFIFLAELRKALVSHTSASIVVTVDGKETTRMSIDQGKAQ